MTRRELAAELRRWVEKRLLDGFITANEHRVMILAADALEAAEEVVQAAQVLLAESSVDVLHEIRRDDGEPRKCAVGTDLMWFRLQAAIDAARKGSE